MVKNLKLKSKISTDFIDLSSAAVSVPATKDWKSTVFKHTDIHTDEGSWQVTWPGKASMNGKSGVPGRKWRWKDGWCSRWEEQQQQQALKGLSMPSA